MPKSSTRCGCTRAPSSAIAAKPSLLIADEPTTGLDVTTQAVIMDLISDLASSSGMATIFITHDLALAAQRADRIAVMHAGHVIECALTTRAVRTPASSVHGGADRGDARPCGKFE
jgi:ABC-type dipeptide/oligopeptide/nickel transport system ATPase component